jgi:hypothetical protein
MVCDYKKIHFHHMYEFSTPPTKCSMSLCKNLRNMCVAATAGVSSLAAVGRHRSSGVSAAADASQP